MDPTLFCMPIKKGKTEAYKAFFKDCVKNRTSEYQDMLKRYDLNTTRMWIHTINGQDYAMFTHDMGPEGAQRLAEWAGSTHPFDQWFDAHLREFYTAEDYDNVQAQPEFVDVIEV